MRGQKLQDRSAEAWRLVGRQHGVVSRRQLLALGLSDEAISRRLAQGRLHRIWRGVYAVGRPELDQKGVWMAAVLACGPEALLGHRSAAALWDLLEPSGRIVEIVVPASVARRRPGIRVHRCAWLTEADRTSRFGIPVTRPAAALIGLAADRDPRLETAVMAADRLGWIDLEALRAELDSRPKRPGIPRLRALLDAPTFTRTDSVLERWFLRLAAEVGLPRPQTQIELNGYRVDFYWPQFDLVVETDGLRYHRTPAQQTKDLEREQAHAAAGLRYLRFSAAQVRHDPEAVRATLAATVNAARLKTFPGQGT